MSFQEIQQSRFNKRENSNGIERIKAGWVAPFFILLTLLISFLNLIHYPAFA